ncbi:MAG: SAM-dependent methyltransferase [Methanothrix sp.]|jgi:precorrin-3B C17-methyltransferase|uniref:SAM-dependent methyltransferase n=1 Tax=Methanothrix sp. TaxID=90426 RepID=UPI0025F3C430|nr:SAM-dependent methyltransferase [Methanothrix sp.]MCK9404853.1 SAM-dependent methyltransferase [Methanothrix sp.]
MNDSALSRSIDRHSANRLSIVGIGPGDASFRTLAAVDAIRRADYVVGYRPYLKLIEDLLPGKEVYSSGMGKEIDRVHAALDLLSRGPVALVSSGDANVYGMAGLGLEMAEHPAEVEVVPGVTSFNAAACRAGLLFRECVAVISLSDLLTPWEDIEGRLRQAADFEMPVALYNPRSRKRDWQLLRALNIYENRDVLVAKEVGREGERLFWTTAAALMDSEALREEVDMTTLLILPGRGTYRGDVAREAEVNLVGTGPGGQANLTAEALTILSSSEKILGAERYLNLIGDYPGEKVAHAGPCPERSYARFQEAEQLARSGKRASILTGGDPSIFSAGWRIMDLARNRLPVHISPGVSAFSSVAARAGAPLSGDFALLSQLDNPEAPSLLAAAGFGVVIYNVKGHEVQTLLQKLEPERAVALARDVARKGEEMITMKAEELMETKPSGFRFTLLISCPKVEIREGRIIARRGYDTKYSY